MQPPIGLLTPAKAAIGQWLADFHDKFFEPDTPANVEWAGRAAPLAMAWAPGRMVDQVESMLSAWARNDNTGVPSTSASYPAVFVAVAPDYTESLGEAGRTVADWTPFAFPQDPTGRSFRVRTMSADLRVQVVVVAPDQLSTMSILGQLSLWAVTKPKFGARYVFGGFASDWPITVLGGDRMAVQTPVGEQVSILALDLTIRTTLPMFRGPRGEEATDGMDPPGFPVVLDIETGHDMSLGPPTGVTVEEWKHFRSLVASANGTAEVILDATAEVETRGR